MENERELLNRSELSLPELRLKDVTEDQNQQNESPNRRSGRKKLFMAGGLIVLLLLTMCGGYFLLRGKDVQVKADGRKIEKITSGSDLQKAAFDSLTGSLNGAPAHPATDGAVTAISSGQTANAPMAGSASSPASSLSGAKIPSPAQPGIAMTLAPPPEAIAPEPSEIDARTTGTKSEVSERANAVTEASGVSTGGSKPKTAASIIFSSPAATTKLRSQNAAAPADDLKSRMPSPDRRIGEEDNKPVLTVKSPAPNFGAMLPVRLMGALYTLRQGALARLELVRTIKTERATLKRGTVFVGSLLGSELDRAYVQIKGFIDPETNGFTPLEGELLGSDGGAGLRGKQRRVSPVWARVLDRAAQSGTQILASVLGRNSSVIVTADPYGAVRSTGGYDQSQAQNSRSFVEVPAGAVGFVLVTALPSANQPDSRLASIASAKNNNSSDELSDAELAELFADADAERIKAALPRMNPELRRIAEMTLREIETPNKPGNR
ncbi:MAG: hypothetical protein AB7U82_34035 [Blastocatellales bacterium]